MVLEYLGRTGTYMRQAAFIIASHGWMPIIGIIGGGIVFIAILAWILIKVGVLRLADKEDK